MVGRITDIIGDPKAALKAAMCDRTKQYSSAVSVALIVTVLAIEFSVTTCQVFISLSKEHGSLCSRIVLVCSFDNLQYVAFEEFVADGFRFSALTPHSVSRNPDYEEEASDGWHKLRISQVERHNGTRYRCHGFTEDYSVFRSHEWQLVVPPKEVCAVLEMNVTVTMEPNNTSTVNSTMQAKSDKEHPLEPGQASHIEPGETPHPEREQAPTWNAALLSLSVIAVLPVVALIAAVLCVVVARARRRAKAAVSSLPAPVQEDGDVANSDAVLAEVKVDHVSTHVPARFSDREMESDAVVEAPIGFLEDMSKGALQTPQVASNNDAAGAIQIGGEMMMYGNIGLQLNRTFLLSAVQQLPAVPCVEEPAVPIPSRNDHESAIDSEDVPMSHNPAYVAMESSHQMEDVPMQGNPAYKALETIIPSAQAGGRVHQLQPPTRTELLEDVRMQGNPSYQALETAIPSRRTRAGVSAKASYRGNEL